MLWHIIPLGWCQFMIIHPNPVPHSNVPSQTTGGPAKVVNGVLVQRTSCWW
jgi:hypothetical protein